MTLEDVIASVADFVKGGIIKRTKCVVIPRQIDREGLSSGVVDTVVNRVVAVGGVVAVEGEAGLVSDCVRNRVASPDGYRRPRAVGLAVATKGR